ncbi:YggT family protein [Candidatus Peregrinibacteria bacterium]|nr:YggT family protein [Candidatus Peregrinibacteria bacterium]
MKDFIILFIGILFDMIYLAIIIRIVLSWFRSSGMARFKYFLKDITDPVLVPFQRVIPRLGMIDISPIIAIIVIDLVKNLLISLILGI